MFPKSRYSSEPPVPPAAPATAQQAIAIKPSADAGGEVLSLQTIAELNDTLGSAMRRQLYGVFEELLPARLVVIENALRCGDRTELQRMAHLLKGSSMMLGATGLGELCMAMEHATGEPDPMAAEPQIARLTAVAAQAQEALLRSFD